jgi:hypothetical protein
MANLTTITVLKPFTLTRDDGTRVSYAAGSQQVEPEVADHWYVKAHTQAALPVAHTEAPLTAAPDYDAQITALESRLGEVIGLKTAHDAAVKEAAAAAKAEEADAAAAAKTAEADAPTSSKGGSRKS